MRNWRTAAVILLMCLASGESFVAWSKHETQRISARRKDYADYFSTVLDSPPPRSLDEPVGSSRGTCLYVAPDLPRCDFDRFDNAAEASEDSGEDYQRIYDRSGVKAAERFPKPANTAPSGAKGGRAVVYSIEGCLPERLPFDMPACEDEDLAGGLFEVRKLYPFRVKASSSKETFVFPEFHFGQWLKMMRRFAERQSSPRTSAAEGVGVKAGAGGKVEAEEEEESETQVNEAASRHRQSVLISATKRKRTMPRATIASRYVSKGSPLNSFIVHRGESEAGQKERRERLSSGKADGQVADDLVLLEFRPLLDSFYRATKEEHRRDGSSSRRDEDPLKREHDWSLDETFNALGAEGQVDSLPVGFRGRLSRPRSRREVIRKGSEFPYAKAIPFDPKKLGPHPRKARQTPRDDSRRSARRELLLREPRHRYKPETRGANRGKYRKISKNHSTKGKRGKYVRQ